MNEIDVILRKLSKSNFRSHFKLRDNEMNYVKNRGMDVIRSHANDFVNNRLASANPKNDGKQTPMRGHPVFIAQHATATCCRSCLFKWHGIKPNKVLSADEREYIVSVIMHWIKKQVNF